MLRTNPDLFRRMLWFIVPGAGLFLGLLVHAQTEKVTREGVAAWLRHGEGLVKSAECSFEIHQWVTKADDIPAIREACRNRGNEKDYLSYVYNEHDSRVRNNLIHWWRKGEKERNETFIPGDDSEGGKPSTTAFDGQIVRTLGHHEDGIRGSIESIRGAAWNAINRIDPFSFLYQFQNLCYSEIIAKGPEFNCYFIERAGEKYTRVSVAHPKFQWCSFVLEFDNQNRLIERQIIRKVEHDPKPRLHEKHRFFDYKAYQDASGETIWFPHRGEYSYYLGPLNNGGVVEYSSKTIRVRDIKFNVDIPDEKFVLAFPKNAKIYDGLTGAGWLEESVKPSLWDPPKSNWWRVPLVVICVLFLMAVVVIIIWKKRRAMG